MLNHDETKAQERDYTSIPLFTTPPAPPPAPIDREDNDDDGDGDNGDDDSEASSMVPIPGFDPSEPMLEDDFDENDPPAEKADEQQVDRLFHALWQRQDKDWIIRKFLKPVFQQLCFEMKLSHRGTKTDMYLRLRPQVRLVRWCAS